MANSARDVHGSTEKRHGVLSRLFRGVWRTISIIRLALANLLFLVLLIVLLVVVFGPPAPSVPDQAALVLEGIGRVVEQKGSDNPLSRFVGLEALEPETALNDLVFAVDKAASDDRIKMIVMPMNELPGLGIARSEEFGKALQRFRADGKSVIAVADWLDQDQYLLASYADEIWLNPAGDLFLQGFAAYRHYLRDGLDKLGIDVHVFRGGAVKDAAEPLVSNAMSEESREANRVWLSDLWRSYAEGVAERRNLPAGAIDNYINETVRIFEQADGDGPLAALNYGLVDELKTREQANEALGQRTGGATNNYPYRGIGFRNYLAAVSADREVKPGHSDVAVLVAEGMILPGRKLPGLTGADSLVKMITAARKDDGIRALVLRVDSPGGVMFAGELIRESLSKFRASGKPLVVSMGAVAASGGYQVSAEADEIWAHETSITGSIGVLAQFPSIERGLEKIGVHYDGVGTTDIAGDLTMSKALSPAVKRRLELTVDREYKHFIDIVANGRDMTVEQVRRAADGRVWSGRQARDLGLVDRLGGLNEALASAAALAGLKEYSVRWLRAPTNLQERLKQAFPAALLSRIIGAHSPSGWFDSIRTVLWPQRNALGIGLRPGIVYSLCQSCSLLPS